MEDLKLFNLEITKVPKNIYKTPKRSGKFESRWADPPSRNTGDWLSMFGQSPRLAVVDRIASDLAIVSGKLLRIEDDGTETEITDHPFLDFLNEPNPLYEMTLSAIWRLHEIYLLLVGESFILIERDDNGKPLEMWNIPPHWVRSTPYKGNPTYSIISPTGVNMTVPIEDMFVMKQLNPYNPFGRGLGTAESIADEVEIDEYAAKFQKRFFYNDATPPTVFVMPDATDEQREAFMARWNKRYKGVENSHKVAALSGDVEIKELGGASGRDLGFLESRIAMRDAVLEHFGVPREIMGITENSNRSTAESAQYIHAKNVLTPKIKMREEAINKQLLPMFDDTTNLIWRYDAIIPFDKDFDKDKAIDGYDKGIIMQNEARSLLGFDDIDGGDIFKELETDEDNPPVIKLKKHIKKDKKIDIDKMLNQEEQAIEANAKLFEEAIKSYSDNITQQLTKALYGTKANNNWFKQLYNFITTDGKFDPLKWVKLPVKTQKKIALDVVSELIDWKKETKELLKLFFPIWAKSYDDGSKMVQDTYGIVSIERPEFTTAARLNAAERITNIEDTTRSQIADRVVKTVSEGQSQETLKKAILEVAEISEKRAKLIARQETMVALATGQYDTMTSAGAKVKTWHHRPQRNPRDGIHSPVDHVSMEGETVGIDEYFSNGLLYPREPGGSAAEVINCRCYITYSGF